MEERKITITNESGEKLVGLETSPLSGKEKYPAVILVHGFGVTKEENGFFDDIASHLVSEGILICRFDFSGCGESEGDYSETSLSKLRDDLSSILDFVKSQSQVDNSRIGILSQSFGTATTITLKPEVKCLIMTSSVSHPKEILIRLFGDGYNPKGISERLRSSGKVTKVKPQFWQDFNNHNLVESIKEIYSPILFIHGSEDDKCPLSEVEAYFRNANKPKEKVVIEGAAHSFLPHRDKLYKLVVDWFKKYLI